MEPTQHFLIDEQRLAKLCASTARNNNELARSLGQPERLSASALMDLYYAQGGRCALSGYPLEYHDSMKHSRRIQLDHIIEKKARSAVANAISGDGPTEYGKVACISNVQWVCRFANMIKEYVRSSGLVYSEAIKSMAIHAEEGFLLRSRAAFLGPNGKREFRERVIREALASNAQITAKEVMALLTGTPGESCYGVVINAMKENGWNSMHDVSYMEKRREAIRHVVETQGTQWATVKNFAKACNDHFVSCGMKRITGLNWVKNEALAMGLGVSFAKVRQRRAYCNGDKKAFVDWLKTFGRDGKTLEECCDFWSERLIRDDLTEEAIDHLVQSGAVYESEDSFRLIAALTRDEAAAIIGVSPNRLKKWGTHTWDPCCGPAFSKYSSKARTFYRHDAVEEFVRSRGSHPLDKALRNRRDGSCGEVAERVLLSVAAEASVREQP